MSDNDGGIVFWRQHLKRLLKLFVLVGALWCDLALAQFTGPDGFSYRDDYPSMRRGSAAPWAQLGVRTSFQEFLRNRGKANATADSKAPLTDTRFLPSEAPIAPQTLSASMTEAKRYKIENYFAKILMSGKQQIAQTGGDNRDLSAGLSFFVATNYAALRDQVLTQKQLEGLRKEMAAVLRGSSGLSTMKDAERQRVFESFVIVGGLVQWQYLQGRDKKSQAEVARVRRTAHHNLEGLLGGSIDKLQIAPDGTVSHR